MVRATKNGSMTQDIFFDYCCHFVKHLPPGFRKDGQPVILFFDGHSSRWNIPAIRYLQTHNIHPFFLPSHTSIWDQPNNNGPNIRFHKCVKDAIKRLCYIGAKNTVWFYNTVLHHAWLDFFNRERQELLGTGVNATTSSYAKTGFHPFQPTPETWRHVLGSLGKLNALMKKGTKSEKDKITK